jgi:hypothetical protein
MRLATTGAAFYYPMTFFPSVGSSLLNVHDVESSLPDLIGIGIRSRSWGEHDSHD